MPALSAHFAHRKPSAIRAAQIEFMKRTDGVRSVNAAIGNVTLPMHPAMQRRMRALGEPGSPFAEGVVKYSATVGIPECQRAFLNIIASSGFSTDGLLVQVTDGGSAGMELIIVGLGGPAGTAEQPILLIDAAYTNYMALASRTGRATVSVRRTLGADGRFSLPDVAEIEAAIQRTRPAALVVIPYDNPTGHYYDLQTMAVLGRLCVKYDLWMVSDEAYRELFYTGQAVSSIWGLTEELVPGITGRRVSIETASKVWSACGLRIGALVTDNADFHARAVAENTANLCPNVIGQWIFAGLAEESHADLQAWYAQQRGYYEDMMRAVSAELRVRVPGLVVSAPDASIYSVIEVRDCTKPGFDAMDFVMYCAREGLVEVGGERLTLLVSPMAGFYRTAPGEENPGRTQMRIAYVEVPARMAQLPLLFATLLERYEGQR
ncbi:MAG: aminotransferase class I/II-fold pyridoxal phosphate-dependent enzyme [Pseudomonadota bacterium]